MFLLGQEKGVNGFYITPPQELNIHLKKPKDIVFVSLKGRFDKKGKTIIRMAISSRHLCE